MLSSPQPERPRRRVVLVPQSVKLCIPSRIFCFKAFEYAVNFSILVDRKYEDTVSLLRKLVVGGYTTRMDRLWSCFCLESYKELRVRREDNQAQNDLFRL